MEQEAQRIRDIIEDQLKLERYQRENDATFLQIENSRVEAYQHIVQLVTGIDIFTYRP
jgi:hypothetical protein